VPVLEPDAEADRLVHTPLLHLKYLTLRGLADLPALILEAGGLPYRATYYGKEDFLKVKPSFEFGRVPVLEVEGHEMSQSASIVRFLAEKAGLAGSSAAEKLRLDVLYETFKDLFVSHGTWGAAFDMKALSGGPLEKEPMLHFRETSNRGTYTAFQKASTGLKTFEDLLASSSGPFLLGGNITYVDLALFQKLHELGQADNMGAGWADQLGLPKLGAFVNAVSSKPQVAAFIHSGRRMPRIKRANNDYVYTTEITVSQPSLLQIDNHEL